MATSQAKNPRESMYLQSMDEVRKVFERFDTNHDGKISAHELNGVLKALGSDSSDEEIARMMEDMDTDKDGYINLQEFAAFCSSDSDPNNSPDEELKEAFELYDQDGNGKISAGELHMTLTRLGESCSVQDCATMIRSVDSDGTGDVCFEEFRKMMSTPKKQ